MDKMEEYKLILLQEEICCEALKRANTEDTAVAWIQRNTENYILRRMKDDFGTMDYCRIKTISNIIE